MTQRVEGNLIGALKKESNLTIKQVLNMVVITVELSKKKACHIYYSDLAKELG